MSASSDRVNRYLRGLMVVLYVLSLSAFSYVNWSVEQEHALWKTAVNAVLLSLPLVLFYGSAYVLLSAWREHSRTGQIGTPQAKVIHWAPRVAALVIIFFVGLFSLDVFDMEGSPLELVAAFLIHSLPSIVMAVLLVFAWRRPVIGFVAFLLAGLFFLRFVIAGPDLANFLLFSGPLLLISALFYADWRWHRPPQAPEIDSTP